MIETLHEPLLVLDPDLQVKSANLAFYRSFQTEAKDTVGRKIFELGNAQWDIPVLRNLLGDVLSNNSVLNDFEVQTLGGRVFLLNARRLEHLHLILLGLRDVTERNRVEKELRQAEQSLRTANEDLLRANTDLKHFSYAVSHDMQEPLRMVTSYTQLLAEEFEADSNPRTQEYIDYAVKGAKRMEALLNDLREYWAVSDQKVDQFVPVAADPALHQALIYLESAIQESGAEITQDSLPTVPSEPYPLILLFQNLVGNAIKYRRSGVTPHIHVSAKRNGVEWTFSVADNGIGIEPQHVEEIFTPFKRLHGWEYSGTGLGLAMARKIVERYRGKIWVESSYGEGSTFYFTLPVLNGD
jgi:light-regulated signal transduction histidine kinase (bacteriophytochrome)